MRIRVQSFPSDDATFRACVERALPASVGFRACEVNALEARLRATYPDCVLRVQHDLAALGYADEVVWYAYRDGGLRSYVPSISSDRAAAEAR